MRGLLPSPHQPARPDYQRAGQGERGAECVTLSAFLTRADIIANTFSPTAAVEARCTGGQEGMVYLLA